MRDYLLNILDFIATIPIVVVLLFVFIIGMYVFWRGCMETGKDKSSSFDVYIISLITSVVVGRLGYILSNVDEFIGFIWYWSPYEKYGDVVYIFRLLPWRFMRIWDGGIVIFALFVGFLIFSTIFVVLIKRWRWRQMFFIIFFSGLLMLLFSMLYTSAIASDLNILVIAVVLLVSSLTFFISSFILSRMNMKWVRKKKILAYIGVGMILLTVGYLSFVFLTGDVSDVEMISAYILDFWTLLSVIFFIIDMNRKRVNIERVSSVQNVSLPEINQPIRLPVDGKK